MHSSNKVRNWSKALRTFLKSWVIAVSTANPTAAPEHPLFVHLGFDPLDVDSLAQRSGLTIGELSAILLQLELDGYIASLPGGLYQRIT